MSHITKRQIRRALEAAASAKLPKHEHVWAASWNVIESGGGEPEIKKQDYRCDCGASKSVVTTITEAPNLNRKVIAYDIAAHDAAKFMCTLPWFSRMSRPGAAIPTNDPRSGKDRRVDQRRSWLMPASVNRRKSQRRSGQVAP